jgi:hypothetical protein
VTYQKFKTQALELNGVDKIMVERFVVKSLVLLLSIVFLGLGLVSYCLLSGVVILGYVAVIILPLALYSFILDYMLTSSESFVSIYLWVCKWFLVISILSVILGVVFAIA